MRAVALALALAGAGCSLFIPPAPDLTCQVCWLPEPCLPGWIGVKSDDGIAPDGCMVVVAKQYECPGPPPGFEGGVDE